MSYLLTFLFSALLHVISSHPTTIFLRENCKFSFFTNYFADNSKKKKKVTKIATKSQIKSIYDLTFLSTNIQTVKAWLFIRDLYICRWISLIHLVILPFLGYKYLFFWNIHFFLLEKTLSRSYSRFYTLLKTW